MYYAPVKFNLNTLYTQLTALCGGLADASPVRNVTHDNGDEIRLLKLDSSLEQMRFTLEVTRNNEKLFETLVRVYPRHKIAYGVTLTRSHSGAGSTLKKDPNFNTGAYMEINKFFYAWLVGEAS